MSKTAEHFYSEHYEPDYKETDDMNTVFIVVDYDKDKTIRHVFSTDDKAKAWISSVKGEGRYGVFEFLVE